jgi:hypothetical protein
MQKPPIFLPLDFAAVRTPVGPLRWVSRSSALRCYQRPGLAKWLKM